METTSSIRASHTKAPQFSAGNTHEAVITKTYYTARKFHLGVQYWTPSQIESKKVENSIFIEKLY